MQAGAAASSHAEVRCSREYAAHTGRDALSKAGHAGRTQWTDAWQAFCIFLVADRPADTTRGSTTHALHREDA